MSILCRILKARLAFLEEDFFTLSDLSSELSTLSDSSLQSSSLLQGFLSLLAFLTFLLATHLADLQGFLAFLAALLAGRLSSVLDLLNDLLQCSSSLSSLLKTFRHRLHFLSFFVVSLLYKHSFWPSLTIS